MSSPKAYSDLKSKIENLNELAWECRIKDSSHSLALSSEAVEHARIISYESGLAWALLIQGFGYNRKSEYNKAVDSLNESLDLLEALSDVKGKAAALEYLGIAQRNLGKMGLALQSILGALTLSKETDFTEVEITNLYQLGVTYRGLANYDKALENLFLSLELCQEKSDSLMEGYCLNVIGSIYLETTEYQKALEYFRQALRLRERSGDQWGEAGSLDSIGYSLLKLNMYSKAIDTCTSSLEISTSIADKKGQANALIHLAEANHFLNNKLEATNLAWQSYEIRKSIGDKRGQAEALLFVAGQQHKADEFLEQLEEVKRIADELNALDLTSRVHFMLHSFYEERGDFQNALHQFKIYSSIETDLHKNTINEKIANLEVTKEAEETHRVADALRKQNNELVVLNDKINLQKENLEMTLAELRATQSQLIQSEKMASLGELTAGIAHEIQNPLNFVNNFSEVSKELIDEMKTDLATGNLQQVSETADDLKQNLEKILHHGKRADGIVKGMLQHSRPSSGERELTDINQLCDEYLRLAYHGYRAKDKSFNAKFETDFDESIPKLKVVPQDISRVVLNLINNAFYAVHVKTQDLESHDYHPLVTVSTKNLGDKVEIRVSDNGSGIPDSVKEKIFQPFFTTKPTGQGTGLGLSLSYDIVKAHSGELRVDTKEGKGTVFTIQLNASN